MTVSKSELVLMFTDYDNNAAPYDGLALKVSLVADMAVVYVGRLVEERGVDRFESDPDNGSVGVDAQALYEALGVALRRADRQSLDRLTAGELPADHPSLVGVERTVATPGIRRRA